MYTAQLTNYSKNADGTFTLVITFSDGVRKPFDGTYTIDVLNDDVVKQIAASEIARFIEADNPTPSTPLVTLKPGDPIGLL